MKPLHTNSLSAWGYVGLFILFCLPYVGTPALLICAFLIKDTAVRNFARALLILTIIGYVLIVVLMVIGIVNLGDVDSFFGDNGGVEVFNYIKGFIA